MRFFLSLPFLLANFIFIPVLSFGQETNSQVTGIVRTETNELLAGATITLVHETTKNIYTTLSRNNGRFFFFNLRPGGPYSITISHTGYETIKEENLFVGFNSSNNFLDGNNNDETADYVLKDKIRSLTEVTVKNYVRRWDRPGVETWINTQKLSSLPSISRNLQDFVRLVPQSKVNGDGMMSLAGQNNKFNAFFIDGSNNNDILGAALSGTIGGVTNTPPISIDALDEIKVLLCPYDAQYSNFTGGSINAITRSGGNEVKGSAWYYFRNENMAGRSLLPVQKPGMPGKSIHPKLPAFFNQTFGSWVSGPLLKNKLFYFLSVEKQLEKRPQSFNFSEYKGNSNLEQLNALADSLRKKYSYEPGSFLETNEEVNATRTVFKIDWNPSEKNKITISYRYNIAERTSPRPASSTLIAFENNGYLAPARIHTGSLEWKHFLKRDVTNRFLFTYTNEKDDYRFNGQPFPQVTIADGTGKIFFGSRPVVQLSLFKATDMTVLDVFKFVKGESNFSVGADLNFANINDLLVTDYFGNYQFRNVNDFLTNQFPSRYVHSFPLETTAKSENSMNAGAKYITRRLGFFINDEIEMNESLRLNVGIRIDGNALPRDYRADNFFNDTASKIISDYYDLKGAVSGRTMKPHYQLAPRIGFTYKIAEEKLTIRGGTGIFSGRILNLWASNIYNSSVGDLSINPRTYGVHFNPNPYDQPNYQTLGLNASTAKGSRVIIAKNFKYPTIFRSSLGAEKRTDNGWSFLPEILFTKNIHEWKITNVNLVPPSKMSTPPDSRYIYSIKPDPELIPMPPNGANPYTAIYLLSNNEERTGFSYSFSVVINKEFRNNFSLTGGYVYENSFALFEPYATAGPIEDQWGQSETVNGKNLTSRSISDMDLGHRFYATVFKKWSYWKKIATSICLFYNGQSGQPFSYVYNGSMINDNGQTNFDLIYIPTQSDLEKMIFVPNTVSSGVTYTGEQQKAELNKFIENDKYLRTRRGQFAERNGARLPFTHIIDLRIQQDFKIRLNKKITTLSIIYDVFNFTNMLNRTWGRIYSLSQDNYALITFAGFANQNSLTPQYQFTPINGQPYSIQTSTSPGNSARWISQLGVKISF